MNKEKSAELIRRLRNCGMKGSLEMQAADYIEELEARMNHTTPTGTEAGDLDKQIFEIAQKYGHSLGPVCVREIALIALARRAAPDTTASASGGKCDNCLGYGTVGMGQGSTCSICNGTGRAPIPAASQPVGVVDERVTLYRWKCPQSAVASDREWHYAEDLPWYAERSGYVHEKLRASLAPVSAQLDTMASAGDGAIYEAVSRRADPEGHAEAMAQMTKVLGCAPVSAQQGAAVQHNAVECDSALRAEPAGQHNTFDKVLTDEQIIAAWDAQWRYHGHEPCKMGHVEFGRTVEVMVATRCRAEGGITNSNSVEFGGISGSDLAAKAPAAPYGYVLKTGHGNRFSEDLAHVHAEVRHMWVPVYTAPAPAGGDDAKDAARWRAFIGSARIKPQGSAGLNAPMANHYAHMGLEIWTTYDRDYSAKLLEKMDSDTALGREWLTKYADVAVAAMSAHQAKKGGA